MTLVNIFVVFQIIFWVVFLMLLPVGVVIDSTADEKQMPGTPKNPEIKKKIYLSAIISICLTALFFIIFYMIS